MSKPGEIWQAHFDAAQKAFEAGNAEESERNLAICAQMSPEIWCGFGYQSLQDGDLEPALRRFREALAFAKRPQTRAACLNNIGSILANTGHRGEAEAHFQAAIDAYDGYADAWANLALSAKWRGYLPAALALVNRALTINPHHQAAAFTKSMILMQQGKFPEAWEAYESRWRNKAAKIRKFEFPRPEWDGHNAKRLLIYAEQGAGDVIMMLRYLPAIKARGIHVEACMPTYLVTLAERCGFDKVYPPNVPMDSFDAHLPMMSLPRIFQTTLDTIPHPSGYIAPPPLSECMEYGPGLNVGICWSGSSAFQHNLWRSTHLTQWSGVLAEAANWHSLQVGAGEDEAALFPEVKTYPKPADYWETACRISGLDLVITIDTSVAHLAGAMGVPVWVLIPHGPDWRWLTDRCDSPWYSSMKLYRQDTEFDWKPVFARIKSDLNTLITREAP